MNAALEVTAVRSENHIKHATLIRAKNICYTTFLHYSGRCTQLEMASIAVRYQLDGPGFDFHWGEIFLTHPDRTRDAPNLL